MAFSAEILYYRFIVRGMTLDELSKRSGVAKSKIQKMEVDRAFPANISEVEKIAKALDVKAGDIFDDADLLIMKAGKKHGLKIQQLLRRSIDRVADEVLNIDDKDKFLKAYSEAILFCVDESKRRQKASRLLNAQTEPPQGNGFSH